MLSLTNRHASADVTTWPVLYHGVLAEIRVSFTGKHINRVGLLSFYYLLVSIGETI